MVTYEELAAFWAADNICRVPAAALARTNLPADAVAALVDVGLPVQVEEEKFRTDLCRADADGRDGHTPVLVPAPRLPGRWYRIGSEAVGHVCVGVATGEVWSVTPAEHPEFARHADAFYSSSLPRFIAYLHLIALTRAELQQLPPFDADEEVRTILDPLQRELGRIDSRALADTDHVWANLMHEMREGIG